MGVFDFLKRKKEEEMPEIPLEHPGMPSPIPELAESFPGQPPFGQPAPMGQLAFPQPSPMVSPPPSLDRELQLISAKLDTLKAQLDIVIQRLERLERSPEERPIVRWR
jgi:hypothetical protein